MWSSGRLSRKTLDQAEHRRALGAERRGLARGVGNDGSAQATNGLNVGRSCRTEWGRPIASLASGASIPARWKPRHHPQENGGQYARLDLRGIAALLD